MSIHAPPPPCPTQLLQYTLASPKLHTYSVRICEDRQRWFGLFKFLEMLHEVLCFHGSGATVVRALQLVPEMDHLGRDRGNPLLQHLELQRHPASWNGVRVQERESYCGGGTTWYLPALVRGGGGTSVHVSRPLGNNLLHKHSFGSSILEECRWGSWYSEHESGANHVEALQLPNPGQIFLLLLLANMAQLVHSVLVLVRQLLQDLHRTPAAPDVGWVESED